MKTNHRFITAALALGAAATISLTQSGRAAAIEWDTDDATAGAQGGRGIWALGGINEWWDGTTNVGFVDGDTVTFGGTAIAPDTLTVTVFGGVQTSMITINSGYTITGSTIDLGAVLGSIDSSILALDNVDVTVDSVLTGSGGLTIAAHGDATTNDGGGNGAQFFLHGTNTFTGGLTVTSGVVDWNSDASFGDAANTITLDGGGIFWSQGTATTLDRDIVVGATGGTIRLYGGANAVDHTGTLTGSGDLRRTDSGTLTMSGDGSAYTGTFINGGGDTIFATANWSQMDLDSQDGSVFFTNTGTTTVNSVSHVSMTNFHNLFIDNGGMLDVSSGAMTFSGDGRFWVETSTSADSGMLTSSSGTLTVTGGTAGPGIIETTDHSIYVPIVDFDGSTPLSLVKTGLNDLWLADSGHTFSGGTTINGGRLISEQVGGLSDGAVTVNDGGQAYLYAAGTYANDFTINGLGAEYDEGVLGAIRFNNGADISGGVTVATASRILAWSGASGTISGTLSGNADLDINTAEHASAIGTVTLDDASGYTGTLVVQNGTLNVGAIGGGVTVNAGTANLTGTVAGTATVDGGTLNLNSGASITTPTIGTFGGSVLNVNTGATVNGDITTDSFSVSDAAVGIGGSVTGTVTIDDNSTLTMDGGTVGVLTVGFDGNSTIGLTVNSALGVTGALTLHGTSEVTPGTVPAPGSSATLFNYGTVNYAEGGVTPDDYFALTGAAAYRSVAFADSGSAITVAIGGENNTWVGGDLTNPTFWDSAVTSNWTNSTDTVFYNGDALTFDNTATSFVVDMRNDVSPYSVTIVNDALDPAYTIGGTGFGITGSTGITKTGTGTLTLGGTTNSYTGAVDIQGGLVIAGGWETLGNASSVTVASGAQFDINGKRLNGTDQRKYDWTVAGTGIGGLGAIVNNGTTNVASYAGIHNLSLSDDASIGGNGDRFDIGMSNGFGVGTIDGGGFTLTKVGTNKIVTRGEATNITYVVDGGRLSFQDSDIATGTNAITVNGTAELAGYGNRIFANDVTLNAGTSLFGEGGGTQEWSGDITVDNAGFSANGWAQSVALTGNLIGSTLITKSAGNLFLENADNSATFTGKWLIDKNTLYAVDDLSFGAVPATATADAITMGDSRIRSGDRAGEGNLTIAANRGITVNNIGRFDARAGGTMTVNSDIIGAGRIEKMDNNTGELTFNGSIDIDGDLRTRGGMLTINSPTFEAGSLRGWNGDTTLNVGTASLGLLRLGEGKGQSHHVTQTAGDVTVSNDIRVGHYVDNTSTYTMQAGTLSQPDTVTSITNEGQANLFLGITGTGELHIEGGTVNTTSLAFGNRSNTQGVDTLTLTGGTLNVGKWGINRRYGTSLIELGGGTVGTTSSSVVPTYDWSASWSSSLDMTLTGTNGDTTFDTNDKDITLSGVLDGVGGLVKEGTGSLILDGANTFTGNADVNDGALLVNGTHSGTVTVNSGGTLGGSGTLAGLITVNTGGAIGPGSSPGVLTVGDLTVNGAVVLDLDAGDPGSVNNDLLAVTGDLIFGAGSTIAPKFSGAGISGTPQNYLLITYSGSKTSEATLDNQYYADNRVTGTPSLDYGTVGEVSLDITFATATLVWADVPIDYDWEVGGASSLNWDDAAPNDEQFFQGDEVTFGNTGGNTSDINLVGSLSPSSLVVDSDSDYTFSGTGSIIGATGLAKTGTGTLTLLTENTYTGLVDILGGKVLVGDGGTTGALGGTGDVAVGFGAEFAYNRSDDLAPGRAFTGGGLVSFDGGGSLTTVGGNGVDFTIDSGTLFARGGDWYNPWATDATVNINNGGTLDADTNSMGGLDAGSSLPFEINIDDGGTWTVNGGQYIPRSAGASTNLTGGLIDGGGEIKGGGLITHTGDVTSTIAARVNLVDTVDTITCDVADGTQADDMVISGNVTNGGTLAKDGPGRLALTGALLSTGTLTVNDGTLAMRPAGLAVGVSNDLAGTGGVIINDTSGVLLLSGDGSGYAGTIDGNGNDVVLNGATAGSGTGGTIELRGATLKLGGLTEGVLLYDGTLPNVGNGVDTTPLDPNTAAITTTASVIQGGIGGSTTLALDGEIWLPAGDWSFSKTCDDGGYVMVDGNELINNDVYNETIFGQFTSPADGWYSFSARVSNSGGGSGPNGAPFSIGIHNGASTDINDFVAYEIGVLGTNTRAAIVAAPVAMAGGLTTGGAVPNTVDTSDSTLSIGGPLVGTDPLVKIGTGTLTLGGASTIIGAVTVQQGTLLVDGSIGTASAVTVNAGATLGGSGEIAATTVQGGGTLAPGASIGAMTTTGNLVLDPTAVFNVEIDSSTGTADAIAVTGNVTITDAAMLIGDIAATPVALPGGTTFVLIDYSAGSLTGTFAGRSEASTIVLGPNTFTLSYVGNGGTAVTISLPGSDYDDWANSFALTGADRDGTADPDGDLLINDDEYAFGLDPTSAASVTPITTPLSAVGEFSYTRRDPALTTLTYTIETSTDLSTWTPDAGATQTVAGTVGDVQTVNVAVTATPVGGKLFVRAVAD